MPATINRRERKKAATAATIVQTAMTLFQQQGFDETSMEQIAEVSDIAKATLYKYFSVKEAIITAYWQQTMQTSSGVRLFYYDDIPP